MATNVNSPDYQEGREKLQEWMREMHHDEAEKYAQYPQRYENFQENYVQVTAKAYEDKIDQDHKEGIGRYANTDYAAGAKAGVQDWQREELKEAERETVKIKVA